MTDVPDLAIAALAEIAMPDHDRLRAVACLAIVMDAHEEDCRANGLDEASIERECRAMAEAQALQVRAMYPAESDRGA